jgi:hypothetical protein
MGLLDDAIREHLDLKRRRGADPAEIERAERDALGPVRRGPEEAEQVDLEHAPAVDDDLPYEDDEEQDWTGPEADEHEARAPASPQEYEPAVEDKRESGHVETPFDGEEPFDEAAARTTPQPHAAPESPGPEPRPSARESEPPEPDHSAPASPDPAPAHRGSASSRPVPGDHASGETAAFDVESEEDLGVGREDVLEETPEFLQDTPDHDRLWFEQRPPKDFDFDG